jgi:hypothetical protein
VTKDFALRERVKLQFRADSFNVSNHVLFDTRNVTPTSGAFGTITNQTNTARVIQRGVAADVLKAALRGGFQPNGTRLRI